MIDVTSFSTIEDGRSVYHKGKKLEWWVDSEEYSIIDMEKDVSKHLSWATYQEANFWFENENGETTRLATDQELITLLRASKVVKFIMTVGRGVHGTQMVDELQIQVRGNELQVDVSNEKDLVHVSSGVLAVEYEDQEWADEPELGVTAAGLPRVEEEEEEHYVEPGFDPEADDPIGADEEWRYFKQQHKEKRTVEKKQVQKLYEGEDPDVVPSDEATMIGEAYVAHTTYDRDNPKVKRGSTFIDKKAFKLVIKQYAIKREFQTYVEHSDRERYRARCADPMCEWRIHAKKLRGCPTFMVYCVICPYFPKSFRIYNLSIFSFYFRIYIICPYFHFYFRICNLIMCLYFLDCLHFRRAYMCKHKPSQG